mmetsp:Transcript_62398/g.157703  ORF Transcript_62398/g.157703 Transcript_62398/m.157703 type:complete len:282 (-) Transcript_62398:109-954(-)
MPSACATRQQTCFGRSAHRPGSYRWTSCAPPRPRWSRCGPSQAIGSTCSRRRASSSRWTTPHQQVTATRRSSWSSAPSSTCSRPARRSRWACAGAARCPASASETKTGREASVPTASTPQRTATSTGRQRRRRAHPRCRRGAAEMRGGAASTAEAAMRTRPTAPTHARPGQAVAFQATPRGPQPPPPPSLWRPPTAVAQRQRSRRRLFHCCQESTAAAPIGRRRHRTAAPCTFTCRASVCPLVVVTSPAPPFQEHHTALRPLRQRWVRRAEALQLRVCSSG